MESETFKSRVVPFAVVGPSVSHVQLFATLWIDAKQSSLSFSISQSLLKFMFIESVMPCNLLILCYPLLLTSVFPSISVFSNESDLCIRSLKYWILSFSITPSNEHSVLISFRTDWLDLLAVQGTLKSLLHNNIGKCQFSCVQSSLWFNPHIYT